MDQRRPRWRSSSSRSSPIAIVVAVVFIQEGQRRIPIQYAKRMVGRRMTAGGSQPHAAAREHGRRHPGDLRRRRGWPFPPTIGQPFSADAGLHQSPLPGLELDVPAARRRADHRFHRTLDGGPVQPADQAHNLRKYGGYIPGIRPGPPTAADLDRAPDAANAPRCDLPGDDRRAPEASSSCYGGFSQATSRALGGTSVLIVVGVALDTMRQMESQMMMRSYEGFLKELTCSS